MFTRFPTACCSLVVGYVLNLPAFIFIVLFGKCVEEPLISLTGLRSKSIRSPYCDIDNDESFHNPDASSSSNIFSRFDELTNLSSPPANWFSRLKGLMNSKSHSSSDEIELAKNQEYKFVKQGGKLFHKRKYEDAVHCFSKAIAMNPKVPRYYRNRALCHLQLKNWDLAAVDFHIAIDMEPNDIKSHFSLGVALIELSSFDEAMKYLQKARHLANQRGMPDRTIISQIKLARQRKSKVEEGKRNMQEELLSYLKELLLQDCRRQIDKMKEEGGNDRPIDNGELQKEILDLELKFEDYISQLTFIFAEAEVPEKNPQKSQEREIPDHLCDKITYEIMEDPVITPGGITYERSVIMEHLESCDFDPVTCQKLFPYQLVPNYALKEVIEAFLRENKWARCS